MPVAIVVYICNYDIKRMTVICIMHDILNMIAMHMYRLWIALDNTEAINMMPVVHVCIRIIIIAMY